MHLRRPADRITRRFAAIRGLEKKFPSLVVSLTVPVGHSGLENTGVSLRNKAESTHNRIDLVDIRAMDYGNSRDMGAAAVSAAQGTLTQVRQIWPTFT